MLNSFLALFKMASFSASTILITLIATSVWRQTPLKTSPNCPEPMRSINLNCDGGMKKSPKVLYYIPKAMFNY